MQKSSYVEHAQHTSLLAPYKYYPSAVPDLSPLFPAHCHSEFEINYILKGKASFTCDNETFVATKGDIFIFSPNQIHSINPIENSKIYYDTLLFKADILGPIEERGFLQIVKPLVNGLYKIKNPVANADPCYDDLKHTVKNIFSSAKNNSAPLDMLLKSDLLKFFYLLHENDYIYDQHQTTLRYADIIRPALLYIEEHFAEELTVEGLANLIPLSKSYFMFCFKKATGVSAITYTTQIRIKKVCELLLSSNKPVTQIAFECGFHNLANFNRQFKKQTGYSPLDYKNLLMKNK